MCSTLHSAPIKDHLTNMVRTIPLTFSVIYWLRIKRNYLMKGSLVVSIRLTFLGVRESIIIKRKDVLTFLVGNKNSRTKKLNWILRIHQPLWRIKLRRLVTTVEKRDMLRKHIGRKLMTWRRRWSILKEMWPLYDQLVGHPMHLSSTLKILKRCMLTCQRMNGLLNLVTLIIWRRMLLYSPLSMLLPKIRYMWWTIFP